MRLDKALVTRGLCRSRGEAQARIDEGQVMADGRVVRKASEDVTEETVLALTESGPRWVSRGALKLEAALAQFGVTVQGRQALDVGASTGGFTQCLLRRGAVHVYAIDVGHGQMVPEVSSDPRVTLREGINARTLTPGDFPHPFDLIVADLSFISLTLVLPALVPLLEGEGDLICLVKPQFEVGVSRLGKGGVVRDAAARSAALARVAECASVSGLVERGRMESPITGGDGNVEYLLWLNRAGTVAGGGE